ncbi:MAG: glutamine--tRNA ligase/YqeY domain fusion protein [Desulfovibrionaceae bacterium]|nr:glutamine--tRNA ligase/YqeY domain fusion protein [Desulfovibrionaceae bacterium]MBF0514992.1 glutamine--tRNA ligase/YqeY domain fusion protein [Desulfovibrionaceae bacterium]
MTENDKPASRDFIRQIIDENLRNNAHGGRVCTRFPPEPNGYLHIGHAKSICLNFGLAKEFGGVCNLRFDDTNPGKEELEYVESIMDDVRWLGFSWKDGPYYASDYFEKIYGFAVELIKLGKAYVCNLSAEEVREHRGTLTKPGRNSPYRDRSVEENLDLFTRMRAGEFPDGHCTLRAKIDMTSPNVIMRDPALFRIRRQRHHRTGDAWLIYPLYDFTHCLSDALEGVTHSICTLEFENNRELYDWVLDNFKWSVRPRQYEFARLNLTYTVVSKRKLIQLVDEGVVSGWDDPRMPTLRGVRRRGYTPEALRDFCERIGVARADNMVDISLLEHCLREDLNVRAPRAMAVLNPVRLVIENYPEGQAEEFICQNHPENPDMGSRSLSFSRELYIDAEDFRAEPPKKFHRLFPGSEVRLRHAYYVTCTGFSRNESGEVTEVRCTYDPKTRGGWSDDGRKVKGTIHWVDAASAVNATVRLYDRLFTVENPLAGKDRDFKELVNPNSLTTLTRCKIEPSLAALAPEAFIQFERHGYFCADSKEHAPDRPVFNRSVALRDSYAKTQADGK